MELVSTAFGALWRSVSWLPGFFFRRRFSKRWLAEHTAVDVRTRHDPISICGGELPEVHIWLVVTNLSHFTIELDRLSTEFSFGVQSLVTITFAGR